MDFLEKIIQFPYLLPMISDKSMHNFIDAQNVEKEVEQQFDDTQNRVVRVVTYKVSPPSGPPSDASSSGSEQSAAAPDPAVAAGTNTSNETSTSGPPSSSTEQKLRHLVNLIF